MQLFSFNARDIFFRSLVLRRRIKFFSHGEGCLARVYLTHLPTLQDRVPRSKQLGFLAPTIACSWYAQAVGTFFVQIFPTRRCVIAKKSVLSPEHRSNNLPADLVEYLFSIGRKHTVSRVFCVVPESNWTAHTRTYAPNQVKGLCGPTGSFLFSFVRCRKEYLSNRAGACVCKRQEIPVVPPRKPRGTCGTWSCPPSWVLR